VRLVEHWFNQQWGWARKDIWLGHDGDRWHVWWCTRLEYEQGRKRFDMTEDDARLLVDYLKRAAPTDYRRWSDIGITRR
jgi:hypothetical protein